MPRFEIAWTFGGYTTVEAGTEELAREKFQEIVNDGELTPPLAAFDPDIVGVYRAE